MRRQIWKYFHSSLRPCHLSLTCFITASAGLLVVAVKMSAFIAGLGKHWSSRHHTPPSSLLATVSPVFTHVRLGRVIILDNGKHTQTSLTTRNATIYTLRYTPEGKQIVKRFAQNSADGRKEVRRGRDIIFSPSFPFQILSQSTLIPADHTSSHNWAYFWLNNQLFCKYLQSFNWQPSHIALASKESKNDDHCELSDYFHAE